MDGEGTGRRPATHQGWHSFWFRLSWPHKKDERGLAASQDLPARQRNSVDVHIFQPG